MASSAQLAIAKASFSAVLLRPDPSPCSRDEIESFHALLGAAINRCSPENVQKCKQWALRYLVQSPARAASLGKYLAALASAAAPEGDAKSNGQTSTGSKPSTTARCPSAKRQRLHVLYILNDLLFHVKTRNHDDTFAKAFEGVLSDLFRSAASFTNSPKHMKKVEDLLSIWQEKAYFPTDLITKLRAVVADAPLAKASDENGANASANAAATNSAARAKNAPFMMPSIHGDPTTPWYDLPAGDWLPAIQPNSTRPIDPAMIRPLQLAAGPAEKTLVEAVKKLLVDVDRIYAKDLRLDADPAVEIDQMGERVEVDEITGDVLDGDTYYGWSRAFCEKMKARRRKGSQQVSDNDDDDDDGRRGRALSSRSRGPSYGSSRSPSAHSRERPAFKRRRLSRSPSRDDDGYTPSRSRSRRRSYSRNRYQRSSRSPPSRSRSRPRGGCRYRRSGSRSPAYSPPPPPPGPPAGEGGYIQPHPGLPPPPPPPPPNSYPSFPPPFPPPPHMAGGGFPPPPPPNFPGQWPPPPPPPPPPNMQMPPGGAGAPGQRQGWMPPGATPAVPWSGGWAAPGQPAPPPPPPSMGGGYPPQHQQQGHRYGGDRGGGGGGGGGGGYGGRGGWNRGGGGRGGGGGSYNRGRGGGW